MTEPVASLGPGGLWGLAASGPVVLLDVHRTPYSVAAAAKGPPGVGWLSDPSGGPRLLWTTGWRAPLARHELDGVPIVARVVTDMEIAPVLTGLGGRWERVGQVVPAQPGAAASVWRRGDGSVLLPFDPNEAITTLWTEAYLEGLAPRMERVLALGRRAYYRARPLLPRSVQIAFRRRLARSQARTSFPRWPVEPALHDLFDALLALVAEVWGRPVPTLAPWPAGHRWAVVLTHDVETEAGLAGIEPLREVERRHGLVSSWNFVPERYPLDPAVRTGLEAEGCEIGVHGLTHDGHDVESEAALAARLPAIHAYAEAWGATGFRAPAMQRSWAAMAGLGFDHDESFPDTDPFQPCRGGCCSWWPVLNGSVVELPLTLAQDHTLFVILDDPAARAWSEKVEVLRARQGLAQVLVHPDYLDGTASLPAYAALLDDLAGDPTAWFALPSEVSRWWRERAASSIVPGPDGWQVAGPASGLAEVVLLPRADAVVPAVPDRVR